MKTKLQILKSFIREARGDEAWLREKFKSLPEGVRTKIEGEGKPKHKDQIYPFLGAGDRMQVIVRRRSIEREARHLGVDPGRWAPCLLAQEL